MTEEQEGTPAAAPPAREKWVLVEGSFNPPTLSHTELVRDLSARYDRVVVMPVGARYGWRRRAVIDSAVSGPHRAAMVDLAFRTLVPNVTVDLADLEEDDSATLTPYDRLCLQMDTLLRQVEVESSGEASTEDQPVVQRLGRPELVVACGANTLTALRASMGRSWATVHVAVYRKPGTVLPAELLPPHHTLLPELRTQIPSAAVREAVFCGRDFGAMVAPAVAEYIRSYMLYRGVPPPTSPTLLLPRVRAHVVWDRANAAAARVAARLAPVAAARAADANMVVCVGGDGFMMRAIRKLFRLRLPFFGINCGHVGFLLNECEAAVDALLRCDGAAGSVQPAETMVVHQLPLLSVSVWDRAGQRLPTQLCFNDAWIERSSGQSAWIEVAVDGEVRLAKMVCDGALVSTAAGSTAYAYAMGVSPIPVGTPVICLVGNNVSQPANMRPVYLPVDTTLVLTPQCRDKRPVRAFVDGVSVGKVSALSVHASNAADCRLVFLKKLTMARKLSMLQFPQVSDPSRCSTCSAASSAEHHSSTSTSTGLSSPPLLSSSSSSLASPPHTPTHISAPVPVPVLSGVAEALHLPPVCESVGAEQPEQSRSVTPQPALLRRLWTQQQL